MTADRRPGRPSRRRWPIVTGGVLLLAAAKDTRGELHSNKTASTTRSVLVNSSASVKA